MSAPGPFLEFALVLVVAVASALAGWRAGRRAPRKRALLAAAGFVLVAWPTLSGIFPDRLYFVYPAFPHGEALFGLAFFLSGVLARTYADTSIRRILQGVLAVGLAYFVLAEPLWFMLHAGELRRLDGEVRDGVTIQTEHYTCVPSSLATVLRRWGLGTKEGEAAYLARTTFQGTPVLRVLPAVETLGRARGLSARVVDTTLEELALTGRPAILVGWLGSIRHAVALIELDERQVAIGDPLRGLVRVPRNEFQREFRWEGLAVLIDARNPGPDAPRLAPR